MNGETYRFNRVGDGNIMLFMHQNHIFYYLEDLRVLILYQVNHHKVGRLLIDDKKLQNETNNI